MKELTFAQQFALIALNAQDSLHMTTVKKIAVRCMAAAAILEWAMEEDGLAKAADLCHQALELLPPDSPLAETANQLLERLEGDFFV